MKKLIEFDLDAPEADKADRLAFRATTRTITSLYERCFEGLAVRRGWKVLLECVPEVTRPEVRDLVGVLTLQVPFDVARLSQLDRRAKKEAILEVLHAGVLAVADFEQWPRDPFERARSCALERKLLNEWWWREPRWNRDRTLSGQVWASHELEAFRAWLVVRDRDGKEIARTNVLETPPDEFEFVPRLGSARWTSATRFALFAKDKSEVGALDVGDANADAPG